MRFPLRLGADAGGAEGPRRGVGGDARVRGAEVRARHRHRADHAGADGGGGDPPEGQPETDGGRALRAQAAAHHHHAGPGEYSTAQQPVQYSQSSMIRRLRFTGPPVPITARDRHRRISVSHQFFTAPYIRAEPYWQ
eukprot:1531269-Pyramimonas_sp.AAC.2